jgi:putative SOS response-associated peptidase YedK
MCGRYTLATPLSMLAEHFAVHARLNLGPRYNIAPTQRSPVVRVGAGGRELTPLRWGFIPSWAKDPAIGARMINARAESVAEKAAFRRAFAKRRCLVPADGFYEWRKDGRRKQPYYIRRRDGAPFAFAGLWDRWADRASGEVLETFTIVTTTPNELVAPIHNRMPVILSPEAYGRWLDPEQPGAPELLTPVSDDELEAFPVSSFVNSPAHDDPLCIKPLA